MTYAEDPCDDCGLRLPRKDLQAWTEQEAVSRETDTYQRFASGKTGYRQGKTTYRIKHLRLCPACYERRVEAALAAEAARRAAQAAAARRTLLTAGVVVLVLIVAVAMCSTLLRSSGTQAGASANEAETTNELAPNDVTNTTADANVAETSAINDAEGAGQVGDAGNDASAAEPPASDSSAHSGAPSLETAVNQALETGQATAWSEGTDGGLVSVGERRAWRGRFCRSYGFTTNGVRSPLVIACQARDGSWHPADTYTNALAPGDQ